MKLSALDLLTRNQGETTEDTFIRAKDLAQNLDRLGYQRLWFAEHHNSPSHSSSAPEILATYMSAYTKSLRLGTGGTMIMHYAPLKIAEQFKTMAALAPYRIDFGIGRAPGGDHHAMRALSQNQATDYSDLYRKIREILALIADDRPQESYHQVVSAQPKDLTTLPQAYLLGSSGNSAVEAGNMGLGYNFARFFGLSADPEIFTDYRRYFQASQFLSQPHVISTYQVVTADTQEELDYLAKPLEIAQLRQAAGQFKAIEDPETVKDLKFTDSQLAFLKERKAAGIFVKGLPDQVAEQLSNEEKAYGFDELMIYAPIFDSKARTRNYKLLMEVLG